MVEAWYMDNNDENPRDEHHRNPPEYVDLNVLHKLTGVEYFKLDPHNEKDVNTLNNLRKDRKYSYEDEVNVSRETLPNYDKSLKKFYEEHLHTDEEIRYVLEGSGYFDVRDPNDKWIRIKTVPCDLIIIPSGIYHRFTLDTNDYIKAKRYFIGEPVWMPYTRPADDMDVRIKYIEKREKGFN